MADSSYVQAAVISIADSFNASYRAKRCHMAKGIDFTVSRPGRTWKRLRSLDSIVSAKRFVDCKCVVSV